MYYFSETFLAGLQTKSERFQQKFFEIVDALCAYFDTEEERADFQKYIQENHFYDKPGNILASMQKQFGGKPDNEELKKKIHQFWAVHHSDKLPEKLWISLILRQKSSQSKKDSCGFFLISRKSPIFSGASQF